MAENKRTEADKRKSQDQRVEKKMRKEKREVEREVHTLGKILQCKSEKS